MCNIGIYVLPGHRPFQRRATRPSAEFANLPRQSGARSHVQPSASLFRDERAGLPAEDYQEALKWFREAAELENAVAMNSLGVMYQKGQGVPADYARAMQWLQKAAEKGSGTAMYNIGVAYERGLGVAVDRAEASKWFAKASAASYSTPEPTAGARARPHAIDPRVGAWGRRSVIVGWDGPRIGQPAPSEKPLDRAGAVPAAHRFLRISQPPTGHTNRWPVPRCALSPWDRRSVCVVCLRPDHRG